MVIIVKLNLSWIYTSWPLGLSTNFPVQQYDTLISLKWFFCPFSFFGYVSLGPNIGDWKIFVSKSLTRTSPQMWQGATFSHVTHFDFLNQCIFWSEWVCIWFCDAETTMKDKEVSVIKQVSKGEKNSKHAVHESVAPVKPVSTNLSLPGRENLKTQGNPLLFGHFHLNSQGADQCLPFYVHIYTVLHYWTNFLKLW